MECKYYYPQEKKVLEAKIAALRAESYAEAKEINKPAEEERKQQASLTADRAAMARLRKTDPTKIVTEARKARKED